MNNSPEKPRISSIPPSYLKIKQKNYKEPKPGIFIVLLRNLSFSRHDELKVKFCEEILNRLEVWTDLSTAVQEKIRTETMDFLNKLVLPSKTQAPEMELIIETILNLATKAEYELGIMVNVEIKNDEDTVEYDGLLKFLDYCHDKINRVTNSNSGFPESEIPTKREPIPY